MKQKQKTCWEAYRAGIDFLESKGIENAQQEVKWILCHLLGFADLSKLAQTWPQEFLKEEEFWLLLKRRGQNEPLQYILGTQSFLGLDFKVNEQVLIPRWDTEILVEKVLAKAKELSSPRIADVGTGSGAIAVSIAYYCPEAEVFALDISAAALAVARENAQANKTKNVIFMLSDLLSAYKEKGLRQKLDIVVSNPPYISTREMNLLPADVQKEPYLALDGGKDGCDLYRRLVREAWPCLKVGGSLLVEIGYDQGYLVPEIFKEAGFSEVELFRDHGDRPRVVKGVKGKAGDKNGN